MLTYPTDTLGYHSARALCQYRDMSGIECSLVADAVKKFLASNGNNYGHLPKPESCALWFYFLNHGKSVIGSKYHPLEPLSKHDLDFVDLYHSKANKEAIRAFYYLLLICVRESRHVGAFNNEETRIHLFKKFGKELADFNHSLRHLGSEGAYKLFLNSPPKTSGIGELCESLQYIFYNGDFSSGFGGPKWGSIADVLVKFVKGEYSAELMVDTVWTLQHNGGAIFNKGMIYTGFTSSLLRILDVQRSGQIPEAIMSDVAIQHFVDYDLKQAVKEFTQRHPDTFGSHVDWYKVEALGSQNKYPHEKKEQAKDHGLSHAQVAALTLIEKKKHLDKLAKIQAAKDFEKNNFEIMPGEFVKVIVPKSRVA